LLRSTQSVLNVERDSVGVIALLQPTMSNFASRFTLTPFYLQLLETNLVAVEELLRRLVNPLRKPSFIIRSHYRIPLR
jgi:hypothetical protein